MGLLDRHREHVLRREHDEWTTQMAEVKDLAALAHDWPGDAVSAEDGIMGRPGEMAYLVLTGASLIEPRRLPGHWSGRSQGFSIPITNGIRYRVGAAKGTFQQGAEVPTPIDQGTVLISDQRAVFAGSKQTREWLYSKLIGFHHDENLPWTALAVSNRQKVSGFLYTQDTETTVRFRLELALAQYNGTRAAFAASIDHQVAELTSAEPRSDAEADPARTPAQVAGSVSVDRQPAVSPAAAAIALPGAPEPQVPPNLPPSGWYPNPQAGGQRYWDGAHWTGFTAP